MNSLVAPTTQLQSRSPTSKAKEMKGVAFIMVIARDVFQGLAIVDCLWCLLFLDYRQHHLKASKEVTDRHGT